MLLLYHQNESSCPLESDNPRTEDPEKIIEDVVVGVEKVKKNKPDLYYEVIADRRQAIKRAVSLAKDDDIVIIAGKGHEDYHLSQLKYQHALLQCFP